MFALKRQRRCGLGHINCDGEGKGGTSPKYSIRSYTISSPSNGGDIPLSAGRIHTDSTDSHDYFPLATPREKLFLSGNVGTLWTTEIR